MKLFRLYIDCGNAAFDEDDCGREIARILHGLAKRVEDKPFDYVARVDEYPLYDLNGNFVGAAKMEDD